MNVSNPTIIRVNNRPYRCLHPTNFKQRSKPAAINQKRIVVDEYDDEEIYIEDFAITEPVSLDEKILKEGDDVAIEQQCDDAAEEEVKLKELVQSKEVKIEKYQGGGYSSTMHVPSRLRGYLIGRNCSNIKEIIAKTKVEIDFPDQRREDPFRIHGSNERDILSAYLQMSELLQSKRKSLFLTHFLAIKCDTDEVRSNYEKFKEIVMSKHLPPSCPKEVFIGAGKLHLTITTLALLDNYERNRLVSYMNKSLVKLIRESLKERQGVVRDGKFQFKIAGLDYMNDDPTSVSVLYGKVVDSSQLIQTFCNRINSATNELKLTSEIRETVKLHMTLMNTRYAKGQLKTFDATSMLKELKDFYFGAVDLNEIHLLISGTRDEKTGGYISTHKINVF